MFRKTLEGGRFKYRRVMRGITMSRRSRSSWMRRVKECQDEIAKMNPHPHYAEEYRAMEVLFWSNIPSWIIKDNQTRKVEACLDIGCGFGTLGLYTKRLLNCDVYATDFIADYASPLTLSEKNAFNFTINNIELDNFPWNKKFDVILMTEVLEHFNFHPLPTLRKIRGLLSDDGTFYLSTPDAAQWGRMTKYYQNLNDLPLPSKDLPIVNDHVYVYTKKELLGVLDEAEFRVSHFGYSPGVASRHFNIALTKQ